MVAWLPGYLPDWKIFVYAVHFKRLDWKPRRRGLKGTRVLALSQRHLQLYLCLLASWWLDAASHRLLLMLCPLLSPALAQGTCLSSQEKMSTELHVIFLFLLEGMCEKCVHSTFYFAEIL